jgi:peptidoglycan hydrolase CwlO-like protein
MNGLIGPKNLEIENLRSQIAQNENQLRNLKISNSKDKKDLEDMENQINSLYNEILKAENFNLKI